MLEPCLGVMTPAPCLATPLPLALTGCRDLSPLLGDAHAESCRRKLIADPRITGQNILQSGKCVLWFSGFVYEKNLGKKAAILAVVCLFSL